MMKASASILTRHHARLRRCNRCPAMHGPPVTGEPVVSSVLLIGQAPGTREIEVHRPFAWTAGKTLFGWFARIGLEEEAFRHKVYMAAVCRCFPGKNPRGGDRVPDQDEINNCAEWLATELQLLKPQLILPVGKLAIAQIMPVKKLDAIIGTTQRLSFQGHKADIIALPHPSGASTWHRTEPGKSLLNKALRRIKKHSAWQALLHADD
jgi:uracil-DNA glycosylase